MNDPQTYFLLPGALKVSINPMEITTLLGSCVAICLWDKKLQQGGINHYMMPFWNGSGLASPKYGNIAIEKLINSMYYIGSKKEDIVAKVFGGAMVLNTEDKIFHIGERNIEIQEKLLKEQGIKVVAKSLGGNNGRKIIFNTQTGVVKMKYVSKNNAK